MGAASALIVVSSGFGSFAFFSNTLMPASTTSKPLSVGCPNLPLIAPPQSLKVVASVSALRQLLAMSSKRAYVCGILYAAGIAEFFTQNTFEDMAIATSCSDPKS
jgi:hypothetical protein